MNRDTHFKKSTKRPISPSSDSSPDREAKQQNMDKIIQESASMANNDTTHDIIKADSDNASLSQALVPLINEFKLLHESVDTVHHDYADLKLTILKQKDDLKHELTDKIEQNTAQLSKMSKENLNLKKENKHLKTRLDHIEQAQLSNNVILTGIPEGPYEPYSTTKLCVQEMVAVMIDSRDAEADLVKAKDIDITSCNRVGKFRHNNARPISITFATRDDKESFLACKRKLPAGVYANEELPMHIKKRRD